MVNIMESEVTVATLALLRERPEMGKILMRITTWEAAHYEDEFFRLGWSWDTFQPPIARAPTSTKSSRSSGSTNPRGGEDEL